MMGPDITVASELSRGSAFTIRLARIVDAPKEVAAAHTVQAALKHLLASGFGTNRRSFGISLMAAMGGSSGHCA